MIFHRAIQTYEGNIIDVHCHLLPGVDDGAESTSQAMSMLDISMKEGITTTVVTPHLVCDGSEKAHAEKIRAAFRTLQTMVTEKGLPVRLILGYEILLSTSLLHIDNLSEYVIEGSNKLLVEPHLAEPPEALDELIYEADHDKLGIILAHPERNQWLASRMDYLRELVDRGVMIQVNAGSITGFWGKSSARSARRMAEQGLVHLIGSDAHSDGMRGPYARTALSMMSNWIGDSALEAVAYRRAVELFHLSTED